MGARERREREREEMREKICRAAMKLFLAEGFQRTSMRKIAEAIEYTPGAIYSYFKDKDEIFYALHNEGFDKLYAMQTAGPEPADPYQRLVRCGEVYLRFALENPEYYDLMFIMDATGNKIEERGGDWKHGVRTYDVLRARVKACMDAGRLPKADPEVAAFTLWSLVHGMAALVIRDRCVMIPPEVLPQLVDAAYHFMIEGMKRGKGKKA